ncbi:MAG: class I SAM-dependent methyltransferase [Candidatus Paceibacterota bacterium]
MKKPDSKKSYSNSKSGGKRNNFERAPRSEKATLRHPYKNKNTPALYVEKAPYAARTEKPVYKGKESRLAGATRNETRVYSGYSARAPRSYSKPQSAPLPRAHKASTFESKLPAGSSKLPAVPDTSWGGVADWYNKHLEKGDDTYHSQVIFPNLLRLLGDIEGKKVLDLACGQGIFSQQLRDKGAHVTGVDVSKELIKFAEEKNETIKEKGTHKVAFLVTSADDLYMLKDVTFDIVVCVLALQNIENLQKTIAEVSRVLTSSGSFIFVLNHPSYRNPKQTYWGYNEESGVQYRRVDEYMSESHVRIDMTPGSVKDKKFTVSFHRPLQVYVKAIAKQGFAITHLEEWVSHRESERGPKKQAEDKARKEIPLFMCIEGKKIV